VLEDSRSPEQLPDFITESPSSVSSDAVVSKTGLPPYTLAVTAVAVIVVGLFFALSGPRTQQVAIQFPTTTVPTTTTPPTTTTTPGPAGADTQEARETLPDRGGMRSIVVGWMEDRCAGIIDGPEPLLNHVYEDHLKCLETELAKVDDACVLAANHYYQYPGADAVGLACAEPLSDDPSSADPS